MLQPSEQRMYLGPLLMCHPFPATAAKTKNVISYRGELAKRKVTSGGCIRDTISAAGPWIQAVIKGSGQKNQEARKGVVNPGCSERGLTLAQYANGKLSADAMEFLKLSFFFSL